MLNVPWWVNHVSLEKKKSLKEKLLAPFYEIFSAALISFHFFIVKRILIIISTYCRESY